MRRERRLTAGICGPNLVRCALASRGGTDGMRLGAAERVECLTLKYPMCSCALTKPAISQAARVARF